MNQLGSRSILPYQSASLQTYSSSKPIANNRGASFEEILQAVGRDKTSEVEFSKHASERLNSRHIELTDGQMERLNQGVEQARNKKINDSLVMLDNLAFIVNVKNNTVVTALTQETEENHVFTNIDGAVIV